MRAAAVNRFYEQIPTLPIDYLTPARQRQLADNLKPIVRPLLELLDDPRRVVRAETGRALAGLPSYMIGNLLNGATAQRLDTDIDEYITGVLQSNDRGGAHMELGVLYETMGDMKKAEEAYRTAIRVEPQMTGPRSNLAALLDRLVESEQNRPEAVQNKTKMEQWEQEAATLRRQELDLLARDVSLLPNSAQLQYRYGLSLYLHGSRRRPSSTPQSL